MPLAPLLQKDNAERQHASKKFQKSPVPVAYLSKFENTPFITLFFFPVSISSLSPSFLLPAIPS